MNTKKLFTWLTLSILSVFLILSPFFLISNNRVYADENNTITYNEFTSSNIFVPLTNNETDLPLNFKWYTRVVTTDTPTISQQNTIYIHFVFKFGNTFVNYNVTNSVVFDGVSEVPEVDFIDNYTNINSSTGIKIYKSSDFVDSFTQTITIDIIDVVGLCEVESVILTMVSADSLRYNFDRVEFSSSLSAGKNYISYYNYSIPITFEFVSDNFFDNRTYYLFPDIDADLDQVYNEGREQGFEEGKKEGFLDGINDPNNNAVQQAIGYDKGIADAQTSEYSFTNLLSAVIDVPVKTLEGLFNFELLGINMLSFFQALLTLSVFLLVIRIIF